MNQLVIRKLKEWRAQIASRDNLELFRVIPNKTIDDLGELLPINKEELLAIKGIKDKKFEKYGRQILAIINETIANENAPIVATMEVEDGSKRNEKIYSVSSYLDRINDDIARISAGICGEVSSVSFKGHLYFSLKDKNDGSVLSCFMWARDYENSGIQMREGEELIIHGFPEIYKPNGKFTFRTSAIELVGEGALKNAYEELKRKLSAEGLFDEAAKKPMPDFPSRIGLITSRDGAVINDFLNNIGRFGYQIKFVNSRVEGVLAVGDLIGAVEYFKDKEIDLLVIIRGGGSLESLQAFNNEILVRRIAALGVPVICGIGHDKDVPLLSYVADLAVSTPSIVAKEINRSWEKAVDRLDYHELNILNTFDAVLKKSQHKLENSVIEIKNFYQAIFRKFDFYHQALVNIIGNISYLIKKDFEMLEKIPQKLIVDFGRLIFSTNKSLDNYEKSLRQNNPERQLALGYSIISVNGQIVKSIADVSPGDEIVNKMSDGQISSIVKKVKL